MRTPQTQNDHEIAQYLDGQLLVAMPGLQDERFARSVIYMCAHSAEGAMGIVVNKLAGGLSLPDLLVQLDIVAADEAIRLPLQTEKIAVVKGGPVETGRGFVLHSPDFFIEKSTLSVHSDICLTATLDILRAIAEGHGPEHALLALGYSGWSSGQLESEIQANGWLHCPANADLLFNTPAEEKYEMALHLIGASIGSLSGQAGHA